MKFGEIDEDFDDEIPMNFVEFIENLSNFMQKQIDRCR